MAVLRVFFLSGFILLESLAGGAWAQVSTNDLLRLGTELLRLQAEPQSRRPPPPQTRYQRPQNRRQTLRRPPRQPAENQSQVAEIQALLNEMGYDVGAVDGETGPRTRRAISAFQRYAGLAPTGRPDGELLVVLRATRQMQRRGHEAYSGGGAVAGAAPFQPPSGGGAAFTLLQGYDLPFGDYRSGTTDPELKNISSTDCQWLCAADGRCRSFTYNSRAQVCILKETVPQGVPYAGAVSGIKGAGAAEPAMGGMTADTGAGFDAGLPTGGFVAPNPGTVADAPPSSDGAISSEGLVAPAPGGAMLAPAPDSGLVAPALQGAPAAAGIPSEPAAGSPSQHGSQALAALARRYSLQLIRGLPLVGGPRGSGFSDKQAEAVSKFLDFVELGLEPGLIEANPACWAIVHLSPDERGRYLLEGADAHRSSGYDSGKTIQYFSTLGTSAAWRGRDEFEADRSKQAFLADYIERLKAQAVALPIEIMLVIKQVLPRYDRKSGGFDLGSFASINSHGLSFSELQTYSGIDIPRPRCSSHGGDFWFSPPTAKLPELWAMDVSRAEQIIKRLNHRTFYVGVSLRLNAMPSAKIEDQHRPSNRSPVWSEITSITMFEDAGLERPIETIPLSTAAAPVLLSGVPQALPAGSVGYFSEPWVALLLLRNHGELLDPEAWRHFMLAKASNDQAFYNGEFKDPSYVPFFPKGFGANFLTQFPEQQLGLFKQWARARAKNLPKEFIVSAGISGRPLSLELPVVDESNVPKSVAALLAKGYSINQILQLDPVGSGQRFNTDFLAGAGKTRQPLLILPNIATSYIPQFTVAEIRQIEEEMRIRTPAIVEITVEVGPSTLVPIDDKSEVFAIQGTPKRLSVWNADHSRILIERAYQADALDPKRLDVASLSVGPGEGDALPLSAEAVDLLVVKFTPHSVSDDEYDQMMVARWEYEASVRPGNGEPVWGRFFVPGKPKPSQAQRSALLARFKEWTAKRAAALPERFRLFYDNVRLGDGSPIVYMPSPDDMTQQDELMAGITVQTCQTQAQTSHPALKPACEYLDNVLKYAPKIHPFGLGYDRTGPRLSCGAVLSDRPDVYCEARQAQFEKDARHGIEIEPGFRDVFVIDQEVFFSGTEEDLANISSTYADMVLEVAVAGVRLADAPLPQPFYEAEKKFGAFRRALGLDANQPPPDESQLPPDEPKRNYFVFDTKILSARLLKDDSQETIRNLKLRQARALDDLELPSAALDKLEASTGPDIVGLRLGMRFAEAEKVIRAHMNVERVLTRDRAHDPSAVTGNFEQFASSKIFVAQGHREFIILYDEPPAASEVVLGITRQMNFPQGKITPSAALAQLRAKYGQEDWRSGSANNNVIGWGKGLAEQTINDSLHHGCLPASSNRSAKDWLEKNYAPTEWVPGAGASVPSMTMYTSPSGRSCGQVLSMEFNVVNSPVADDRMVLHLLEPNVYRKHHEESKRLIQTGEVSPPAESGSPDLKL